MKYDFKWYMLRWFQHFGGLVDNVLGIISLGTINTIFGLTISGYLLDHMAEINKL